MRKQPAAAQWNKTFSWQTEECKQKLERLQTRQWEKQWESHLKRWERSCNKQGEARSLGGRNSWLFEHSARCSWNSLGKPILWGQAILERRARVAAFASHTSTGKVDLNRDTGLLRRKIFFFFNHTTSFAAQNLSSQAILQRRTRIDANATRASNTLSNMNPQFHFFLWGFAICDWWWRWRGFQAPVTLRNVILPEQFLTCFDIHLCNDKSNKMIVVQFLLHVSKLRTRMHEKVLIDHK